MYFFTILQTEGKVMTSYYALAGTPGINSCNRASDERPIIVNCAGIINTEFPFTTDNPKGRDDYYLLYMVKGKMSVRLFDKDITAEPGAVFIFPPHYGYKYTYSGGEILDPTKGKVYGCEMWREGEKLIVRGKIAFLGRNQTWLPYKTFRGTGDKPTPNKPAL